MHADYTVGNIGVTYPSIDYEILRKSFTGKCTATVTSVVCMKKGVYLVDKMASLAWATAACGFFLIILGSLNVCEVSPGKYSLQPGRPGCSIHTSLYANRGDFDGRSSLDV